VVGPARHSRRPLRRPIVFTRHVRHDQRPAAPPLKHPHHHAARRTLRSVSRNVSQAFGTAANRSGPGGAFPGSAPIPASGWLPPGPGHRRTGLVRPADLVSQPPGPRQSWATSGRLANCRGFTSATTRRRRETLKARPSIGRATQMLHARPAQQLSANSGQGVADQHVDDPAAAESRLQQHDTLGLRCDPPDDSRLTAQWVLTQG